MTLRQPTVGHGGNARLDEEGIGTESRPIAQFCPPTDRFVPRVNADSTDEELEELAAAIAGWIDSIDPDFFLPAVE